MYAKKRRLHPLSVALILLLAAALTGAVAAKYIFSAQLTGSVTVSAQLVESITLTESEAVRQSDGSYRLNTAKKVTQNEYILLPGLDIPKDPTVIIEGKTGIDAYLFVEIVDTTGDAISYTLTGDWAIIGGLTGKHGGAVYYYSKSLAVGDHTLKLLEDDTVCVSQKLKSSTPGSLTFYACMGETALDTTAQNGNSDPEKVYEAIK